MEIKGQRGWSRGKCGGFHRGGGERTIKKVVERRAAAFTVSLPELKSWPEYGRLGNQLLSTSLFLAGRRGNSWWGQTFY